MHNHRLSKKKEAIRLIVVYIFMAIAIISIVTLVVFFVMGFRIDLNNKRLEQYSVLQFKSIPSGATVMIDGVKTGSNTPSKSSISAGQHSVAMELDGYDTWSKTISIESGTMTWLNYTLFIPKKLAVESVSKYESMYMTLASPDGHNMLIEQHSNTPVFDLVNLDSNTVKTTRLTISASIYSESNTPGVVHTFEIEKWDTGGRYTLVKHTYGNKNEWLVLDTQDATLTKNISRLFDVDISDIALSGTSGNIFYILDSNDIRKLDLSARTISTPLASNVTSFKIYDDSNIIIYSGISATNATNASQRIIGLYREGDNTSYIIRYLASGSSTPLYFATTHYFNEDYVAIAEGKKVSIFGGSYPNTKKDSATSLKLVTSFNSEQDINELMFSPTGEYVLTKSNNYFTSYDLEYQLVASSTIDGTSDMSTIKWIDDNHIWSDRDGKLSIRDFDGTNVHVINPVVVGQDATLTHNGRFLYSTNKTTNGYQLQRVRMILP
jgi:hypothetical protein